MVGFASADVQPKWLDGAVEDGFVSQRHRATLIVESHPEALLQRLAGGV